MPLSSAQENLLHEIYQVTKASDVVIDGNFYGIAIAPQPVWIQGSLRDRLAAAIVAINADLGMSDRVGKILGQYDCLGLDPSNIDRNGYSFRYNQSVKRLKEALYTYTGIIPSDGQANNIGLG